MRKITYVAWLAAPGLALAACSGAGSAPIGDASGGNGSSGGSASASGGITSPSSGGASFGGAVSLGGATSGGATTGGSSSGGASTGGFSSASGGGSGSAAGNATGGSAAGTSGGSSSMGGAGKGGSAGASNGGGAGANRGGAGGSTAAGSSNGGTGNPGGGNGGAAATTPSPGCSKGTGRPTNGVVTASDRIYNFPTSYDGKTPMRLLLALHAAGNPNTQLQSITNGSRLEANFVRIFPKSAGSAWVYDTDVAKVNSVLTEVLANYCIDTSQIFGTGHSSGAQMIVQMLCKGEKRFKGVAPVAASKYCASVAPIPVMYIQGMMDAQRGNGNGIDVVNFFRDSNTCGTTTAPKTDVPTCTSSFDRMTVTPGCVTYQSCTVPTIWCSHNDNGYNNTDGKQHGWPCFASNAMADFFMGLP